MTVLTGSQFIHKTVNKNYMSIIDIMYTNKLFNNCY